MENKKKTLLNTKPGYFGPITKKKLRRSFLILIMPILVGYFLSYYSGALPLQLFGLGLALPGGGFLAHADFTSGLGQLHFLYFAAGFSFFIFSTFIWFATGNALAPPIVWLLLAMGSSFMNHGMIHNTYYHSIYGKYLQFN